MTEKQKIAVAVGVGLLIISFAFIYRQFADRNAAPMDEPSVRMPAPPTAPTPSSASPAGEAMMQKSESTPATPDAVVDDILKNDAGTSALDDEANGETQSAKENVQTVDDITNSYHVTQQ